MNVDKAVMLFAGVMVLVSLLLGIYHSIYWLWLTAFVGANLVQASFTGFCTLAKLLKKFGFQSGSAFE